MSVGKRLKNYFSKLLWRRVRGQFKEELTSALNARLGMLETNIGDSASSWRHTQAVITNTVRSVAAFGPEIVRLDQAQLQLRRDLDRLVQELDRLQAQSRSDSAIADRLEFARREILFEFKYGAPSAHPAIAPKILSPKKLEAAKRKGLRVNLGCGHHPIEGYINVDQRELPNVDVVADVRNLPFEKNSVVELSSAHLLEHFPEEEMRRTLLPYWKSLMAPGGVFRAVVPDGDAMLGGLAAKTYDFADFREVLFGAQDYEGDFHYNLFTPDTLGKMLSAAGFKDVQVPVLGRRNGKCFEFEIRALAP